MEEQKRTLHEYSEFSLGEESRGNFLKNVISALGYNYSGPDVLDGLSGLKHRFEAIATRDKNILLIVGGAEKRRDEKRQHYLTPRERMETWRNSALLSSYDVQNVLSLDGYIIDLMFFHNISYNIHIPSYGKVHFDEWVKQNNLAGDLSVTRTQSVSPIQTLDNQELAAVAQSIGASFLSLDDLSLKEIASLILSQDQKAVEYAKDISKKLRLLQYFYPPTDELLLGTYDISKRTDKELAKDIYHAALTFGHQPGANVIVPQVDFKDPVATAIALEKHKYIEYQSSVEITGEGKRITQTIKKTAQGSFIIRLLKSLGITDLAKAILDTLKS